MTSQDKNRIVWVDSMKLFACLLVVVGHLYMSMEAGGWISGNAFYYCFPIQTVYTFHVPLFFVCSGYLYQRKKVEYSVLSHINNIKNKALNLGVPYFVFTLITIMLKIIFSDDVNNQATPVILTIFWKPVAPYWYLYALFFIFCVIPRQRNRRDLMLIFLISVIAKIMYVFIPRTFIFPDIIGKVVGNAIWFSFGMILTDCELRKKILNKAVMAICFILGVFLSLIYYRVNYDSISVQFIIATMFVYAFVSLFVVIIGDKGENIVSNLSKYFMAVFLMHTIVAAGVRILMLKIGIKSLVIHFPVGLLVSILVPILVYEIACRKWWLIFWIEPSIALKMKRGENV